LKPCRINDSVVVISLFLDADKILNQSVKTTKFKPTEFSLVVEIPLRVVEVGAIVENADAAECLFAHDNTLLMFAMEHCSVETPNVFPARQSALWGCRDSRLPTYP
jgi:hypothetical protein